MTRSIASIVDVFGLGRIQDFLTLLALLEENGYTLADLARHRDERIAANVDRARAREAFQAAFREKARRCPACGTAMNLMPVNTGPRDQVGGRWRSQWLCPNSSCMETVFSSKTPAEIVRGLGLAPPERPPAARPPTKRQPCGGCNGKA